MCEKEKNKQDKPNPCRCCREQDRELKKILKEQYITGKLSTRLIGEMWGVTHEHIRKLLIRYKIPTRTQPEAMLWCRTMEKKESLFTKIKRFLGMINNG